MKAIISRRYTNLETLGKFIALEGEKKIYECVTLELPNNGNQTNTSCIPEGVYKVDKIFSPTKGKCFLVNNVQGRSGILIHKGNYAAGIKIDTKGCILVGEFFGDYNADGSMDVGNTAQALSKMLELLNDSFELHII